MIFEILRRRARPSSPRRARDLYIRGGKRAAQTKTARSDAVRDVAIRTNAVTHRRAACANMSSTARLGRTRRKRRDALAAAGQAAAAARARARGRRRSRARG